MEDKILNRNEAAAFCDSIEISTFAKIQPYGAVILLKHDLTVAYYSENVCSILQTTDDELLSKPITDFLGSFSKSVNVLERLHSNEKRYDQLLWQSNGTPVSIYAYIHHDKDHIYLEIEQNKEDNPNDDNLFDLNQTVLQGITHTLDCQNLTELAERTCAQIKSITGYDRVIIYQFDKHDDSGVVIGESANVGMDSYLGLHFPANDIPKKVRDMYLEETIRYIPSIKQMPCDLKQNSRISETRSFDVSSISMRMVVPVHVRYMRNMGVSASLSAAIIQNGELWGLIACHHVEEKYLSVDKRLILQLLATTFAAQIQSLESRLDYDLQQKALVLHSRLSASFERASSLKQAIDANNQELVHLVSATGMSYIFQDQLHNYGKTPDDADIYELTEFLNAKNFFELYATDRLPFEYPNSLAYKDKACGLLAINITSTQNHYMLFYKPEQISSIEWAGDPSEVLRFTHAEYSPRDSFRKFLQLLNNQSTPWSKSNYNSASFIRSILSNKKLHDLLAQQALHDPLTNLLNRLYLEQNLSMEIKRVSRGTNKLCVLILDLDYFKRVNDTYGHQAGDTVLIHFAKFLKSFFRGYDYIYRIGGEEFLIILPDIGTDDALDKAEQLRSSSRNLIVNFNETSIHISISIGVASYPEHGREAQELIAGADKALYMAKNNGRNRVCLATI